MDRIIHRAQSRGTSELGWLHSRHTFSFGEYRDPERVHFGKLRVLNDDEVEPGQGFPKHSHNNMEIISLPLEGSLKHQDSTGALRVIRKGDVQIMSAGTGVTHSEYNGSEREKVHFLQIWVLPGKWDIPPRYAQKSFREEDMANRVRILVSPDGREDSLKINQEAFLSFGSFEPGMTCPYRLNLSGNGLYLFVTGGRIEIAGETLENRDGIGVTGFSEVEFRTLEKSGVVFIEVPMGSP